MDDSGCLNFTLLHIPRIHSSVSVQSLDSTNSHGAYDLALNTSRQRMYCSKSGCIPWEYEDHLNCIFECLQPFDTLPKSFEQMSEPRTCLSDFVVILYFIWQPSATLKEFITGTSSDQLSQDQQQAFTRSCFKYHCDV